MTTSAEFNFFVDPGAAYFVLDKICVIINLATLDVCLENSFSWVRKTIGKLVGEWFTLQLVIYKGSRDKK